MARFKSFDGLQLTYDLEGDGFPTVLIHGLAQDVFTSWVRPGMVDRLKRAGRKVVALDSRGHGMSKAPHEVEAYADDAVRKDVAALVDHLELDRFDIVGYSMGAISVMRLLPGEPRVRAAVLGGIGAGSGEQRGGATAGGSNPLARAMLTDDKSQVTNPIAKSFRDYADVTGADRKALAAFIEGSAMRGPMGDLASVQIPVLVIAAQGDPLAHDPEGLAARFPNAKSTTVPGTHLNVLNNPAFQDAIVEFLTAQDSA